MAISPALQIAAGAAAIPAGIGIAYTAFSANDRYKSPGKATVREIALPAVGIVGGAIATAGGAAAALFTIGSLHYGLSDARQAIPFGAGAVAAVGVAALAFVGHVAYQSALEH